MMFKITAATIGPRFDTTLNFFTCPIGALLLPLTLVNRMVKLATSRIKEKGYWVLKIVDRSKLLNRSSKIMPDVRGRTQNQMCLKAM